MAEETEAVTETETIIHLLQQAGEWVSPAPHGLGPSECQCDACVSWWEHELKVEAEQVARRCAMAGRCAQCGWPRQSIASWRRLCACQ